MKVIDDVRHIRIATRKSDLALWQAHWVEDKLEVLGHSTELILIETQGDREQDAFRLMQGQGFFTKAVQDAVLAKEADIAVHFAQRPTECADARARNCRHQRARGPP